LLALSFSTILLGAALEEELLGVEVASAVIWAGLLRVNGLLESATRNNHDP
jgi:hypothetical protein